MLEEKFNLLSRDLPRLNEQQQGRVSAQVTPVLATPATAAAATAGATLVTGSYAAGVAQGPG